MRLMVLSASTQPESPCVGLGKEGLRIPPPDRRCRAVASKPTTKPGGALQDPVLELHNNQGALSRTNHNRKDDNQAEILATGIPPTNDRESAIVATLYPDNYTAIVRGVADTTGVALVEA